MNVMFFIIPKCDVAYVYDDFNVRQVLEKIEYYKFSAMPIIDHDGHYVGTITEGDLLSKIKEEYTLNIRDAENIPISTIRRRRDNKAINAQSEMEDLIDTVIDQNFVPVVDDKNIFVGIITRKAIITHLFKEMYPGKY
ncbi:MAG: CBS domain-containing protein [Butyrivibrio sp.]